MKRIIMALALIAALLSSGSVWATEPYRDPNAALRYLMAMGFMPTITDDEGHKLSEVNSLETYAEIPLNLKTAAGEATSFRIKKLLADAAKCRECNFIPDSTCKPEDIVPPYKLMRKFARLLNAGAWKAIHEGRHEEGAGLLVDIFKFGDGIENNGPLISYMFGHAIREIAVNSMKNLVAGDFKPDARKIVTDYLKSLPRPAFPVKEGIKIEKTLGENVLLTLVKEPKDMVEMIKTVEGSYGDPQTPPPASSCNANQRVLMGALEMAMMDGKVFSEDQDYKSIEEKLVKDQYLKAGFACPSKGEYKIVISDKDIKVSCSCGADPNVPLPAVENQTPAPTDQKLLARAEEYLSSGNFDKDRKEYFELHDKILAVDDSQKDVLQKIDAITADYSKSENWLIKGFAVNFHKCFEKQVKLQEAIDNMIK